MMMRNSRDIERTAKALPAEPLPARMPERRINARHVRFACATVAVCCLATTGALARPVTFPKDDPKVAMDVPDDLAVEYTPFGLEITSPDRTLYIVADILPREKAEADAWARKAASKMQAFGVEFNQPGRASKEPKPAPLASAPPSAASATPSVAGKAPGIASTPAPLDRSAPTFTFFDPGNAAAVPAAQNADPTPVFSGAPSLATPAKPEVNLAVRTDVPAGADFTMMAPPSTGSRPNIPFKVGHFANTMLAGAPIDVEIIDFGVSQKQLFLVLQASRRSDDRAAEILKSVKPAS
jgi:hypothetical protein